MNNDEKTKIALELYDFLHAYMLENSKIFEARYPEFIEWKKNIKDDHYDMDDYLVIRYINRQNKKL